MNNRNPFELIGKLLTLREGRKQKEKSMITGFPYIDPNVEYVGVSRLRTLNATTLRKRDKALVIQDNEKPLAVMLTYEQYLDMQKQLESVVETIDLLSDSEEVQGILSGMSDVRAGKTRPISDIRAELKKKRR